MRILCLCNVVPYPAHGGVQLRVLNLLRIASQKHEITIGCHSWSSEDEDHAAELSKQGIRTVTGPLRAFTWRTDLLPALGYLLAARPPEMAQFQSPVLHAMLHRERFDIVQVEETWLAPYAASIPPRNRTRTVLTFHNVHSAQARSIAAIEPSRWKRQWRRCNARMMSRYEPAIALRFDRVITVSESDRRLLTDAAPHLRVDVVPNGVDTLSLPLLPEPEHKRAILFIGTLSYRPCIDAAQWLVNEILPLLRRHFPSIELWLIGKDATEEVCALAAERVYVESSVPDVVPYYRRASIAVAPLRAGGGSRLKILEAMSLGRAVVSTTVGAEGLDVTDGENILLADDTESFARCILLLLTDDELRQSIVRNARHLVEERYDWREIAKRQLAIYDELAATRP